MKKLLFVFLVFSLLTSGCDYLEKKATEEAMKSMKPKDATEQLQLDESEKFHAVVELEMTLAEVADTNKVAEPFLKNKLGIAQYVTHPYTILQLSRNYKFTVDDLKRIIEQYKDDKMVQSKKTAINKKEIN